MSENKRGRPKSDRKPVAIRLTSDEIESFRTAAAAKGLDWPTWARQILIEAAEKEKAR
jgi:predicted DNA binding CopG/RHH family protein